MHTIAEDHTQITHIRTGADGALKDYHIRMVNFQFGLDLTTE